MSIIAGFALALPSLEHAQVGFFFFFFHYATPELTAGVSVAFISLVCVFSILKFLDIYEVSPQTLMGEGRALICTFTFVTA